jgi:aminoglycoside 2''-phosphotransferase
MKENIQNKLNKIQTDTGIKINSHNIINSGADSILIEINDIWMFRFPKEKDSIKKMIDRLTFLSYFSKQSPLKIPDPKYIGEDYIGYKKISGIVIGSEGLKNLTSEDKQKIAKQLGKFLKELHNFEANSITFQTGYHIMRIEDYEKAPEILKDYLTPKEFEQLNIKHQEIKNNPDNFVTPSSIIHGDFNFNNILWNKEAKEITGIIDWAEAGLGIPAMDFIGIADFNDPKNDEFLKDILSHYGKSEDKLFIQIKQNSIIETMNWFWWYYKNNKEQCKKEWINE